jgi:hypothetical protein
LHQVQALADLLDDLDDDDGDAGVVPANWGRW